MSLSKSKKKQNDYGRCELCQSAIEIPGEDGYLCSSRVCGEKIIIRNSKTKQVISTHAAKGWVKYADIPILKRRMNYSS
jgi:predicted RNA-binding Zn-ribbon protein involved in translation (DUF1610 family)